MNRGNQFNQNQNFSASGNPNQPGGLRISTPNFQHNIPPNNLQPTIQTPQVQNHRTSSQPPVLNRGSNPSFGSVSLRQNQLPQNQGPTNQGQLRGSTPDLPTHVANPIPMHLQPTQQQLNRHSSPNYHNHNNNNHNNSSNNNLSVGYGGPSQPNYQPGGSRLSMPSGPPRGNPGGKTF